MREYEIVYIFRSNFTPEEIEAKVERYHAILTGDGNGEITAVEQWGKRQLAYPIEKQPNGYYLVAQFTADPAVLPELERMLKLEEDLLRYLIVLSEGELPIAGSMQSEMDDRFGPGGPPRRDSDDEQRPSADVEGDAKEGEASADTAPAGDDAAGDTGAGDVASDDVTEGDEGQGDKAPSEAGPADDDGSAADEESEAEEADGVPAGDGEAGDDEAGDNVEEAADDDAEEEADEATDKED
ncbi:MAG: 30S ribosomal protein S6 [Gemmatimonadota bacterium]